MKLKKIWFQFLNLEFIDLGYCSPKGIYIIRVLHHSKDYDREFLDLQNS